MKKTLSIFTGLIFIFLSMSCQTNKAPVYLFKNRYNFEPTELVNSSVRHFEEISILGQYMIDPKRNGSINYDLVTKYLNSLYPDVEASGVLCINLEGKLFKELGENYQNPTYDNAVKEYVQLVEFVKAERPNLSVGVYGLPFKAYYDSQVKLSANQKLDPILEKVDVILPSLYVSFPSIQKGVDSNLTFFKNNLDLAFSYAERLNKPVMPFMWYFIHPTNARYGYEMIPKDEMDIYLSFVDKYRSPSGLSINGIVWWDTPTPFNNQEVKTNLIKSNNISFDDINDAFKYYFNRRAK